MKYKWPIDVIKKEYNKVKLAKDEQSALKQYIYSIMLKDFGIDSKNNKTTLTREEFFEAYNKFDIKYFDSSFFKMISYLSSMLENVSLDDETPLLEKRSPDYVIRMCRDFHKRYDKSNLGYFKKIIATPSHIHFFDEHMNKPFSGRSYIVSSNEFYMIINGINYFQDIAVTVHEGKHIENHLKGVNHGIALYQELPSYIYEMYSLDYLEVALGEKDNVKWLRKQTIYKYVEMIRKMNEQIIFIKKLFNDNIFFSNIFQNFNLYIDEYKLEEIYAILRYGYSESFLSHIVSFIVGTDVYLNTPTNNIDNVLSCYIFGMYKMKPAIIDGVVNYICTILDSNQKQSCPKVKYI